MRVGIGLGLALAVLGCNSGGQTVNNSPASPATQPLGTLQVNYAADKVDGSYTLNGEVLTFTSVLRDAQVREVTLTLHGLTLDATIDPTTMVINYDGFASDTGGNTQVVQEDRDFITSFLAAFSKQRDVPDGAAKSTVVDTLIRQGFVWNAWPTSMDPKAMIARTDNRSASLCGSIGSAVQTTHDDWSHSNWSSHSSLWAYIGDFNGDGGTWSYGSQTGYTWQLTKLNHDYWPTQYGSCYGRCGEGCSAWWDGIVFAGPHVYSQACANHDNCESDGHSWAASLPGGWCSDEFASASWDAEFDSNCY